MADNPPEIPVHEKMMWEQYQLLIITKLNEHSAAIQQVESKVDAVRADMATMKVDVGKLEVRAGFWGFLAGLVPAAIAALKLKLGGSS